MVNLKDCQEFAEMNNFELSKVAEKIITRTNANNGYCPCVSEKEREEHPEIDFQCPCSICKQEVEIEGHCHCGLYLRKK